MATFVRIETRFGFEDCPDWKEGYQFEADEFVEDDHELNYAIDKSTGKLHVMESLTRLD